jgi:hypothetical protein
LRKVEQQKKEKEILVNTRLERNLEFYFSQFFWRKLKKENKIKVTSILFKPEFYFIFLVWLYFSEKWKKLKCFFSQQ